MKLLSWLTAIVTLLLLSTILTQIYYGRQIHSPELVEETKTWFLKHQAEVETMVKALFSGQDIEVASAPVSGFLDANKLQMGSRRMPGVIVGEFKLKPEHWLWVDLMAGVVEIQPVSHDYAVIHGSDPAVVKDRGMPVQELIENWQIIQLPIHPSMRPEVLKLPQSAFVPLAVTAGILCFIHLVIWPGRALRRWIRGQSSLKRRITAALRWRRAKVAFGFASLVLISVMSVLTATKSPPAPQLPYFSAIILALAAWFAVELALRWKPLVAGSGEFAALETSISQVSGKDTAELNAARKAAVSQFVSRSQPLHQEGIPEQSLISLVGPVLRISNVMFVFLTVVAAVIVFLTQDTVDAAHRKRFGEIPKDWIASKSTTQVNREATLRGRVAIVNKPYGFLYTQYHLRLPDHLRARSVEEADTIIAVWSEDSSEVLHSRTETTIVYNARTGREVGRSSDTDSTFLDSSYLFVEVQDRRAGIRYPAERFSDSQVRSSLWETFWSSPSGAGLGDEAMAWILGMNRLPSSGANRPLTPNP